MVPETGRRVDLGGGGFDGGQRNQPLRRRFGRRLDRDPLGTHLGSELVPLEQSAMRGAFPAERIAFRVFRLVRLGGDLAGGNRLERPRGLYRRHNRGGLIVGESRLMNAYATPEPRALRVNWMIGLAF